MKLFYWILSLFIFIIIGFLFFWHAPIYENCYLEDLTISLDDEQASAKMVCYRYSNSDKNMFLLSSKITKELYNNGEGLEFVNE